MARSDYRGIRLAELVQAVEAETNRTGLELCDAFAEYGQERIRENTPVQTARLRRSWKLTPARAGKIAVGGYVSARWSGRVWRAFVTTDVPYAEFVEKGTGLWGPRRRKYKIEPKKPGGVLVFRPYLREDGSVVLDLDNTPARDGKVYRSFVMHPGSPGQHMVRIGTAKAEHDDQVWSKEPLAKWASRVEARMRRVRMKRL